MFRLVCLVLVATTVVLGFRQDLRVEQDIPSEEGDIALPIYEDPVYEEEQGTGNFTENDVEEYELDSADGALGLEGSRHIHRHCRAGFHRYGSFCIHIGRSYVTWFDALTICKCVGGNAHLAEIRTRGMQHMLRRLINRRKGKGEYWIGGNNLMTGRYVWTKSGAPVGKSLWAKHEPNNVNKAEHCTEFRHNGRLNDNDCRALRRFICVI